MRQLLPKEDGLTVRASPGIDPQVRRALETVWKRSRLALAGGADAGPLPNGAQQAVGQPSPPWSVAVLPVFEGETLVALLYLDRVDTSPQVLERLTRMLDGSARMQRAQAGRAAGQRDSLVEGKLLQDLARERLLLLLRGNEWNISRVARILGVTRRTVYLRLRRYGIPRERVPKAQPHASG